MDGSIPNNEKATFIIKIEFQKHCTWQGTIVWVEGKKNQKFRSELEMIKLMIEALTTETNNKAQQELISW
ncbi:MAG: hypothetical protein ACOX7H_08360 [Bacillota bacterium]|jgi:hypothetical protein